MTAREFFADNTIRAFFFFFHLLCYDESFKSTIDAEQTKSNYDRLKSLITFRRFRFFFLYETMVKNLFTLG